MTDVNIKFFSEDISFALPYPNEFSEWIFTIIHSENFKLSSLTFIFCSDPFLLTINKDYLDHDYFTDIITFDNSDFVNEIEGDIFISVDRVIENANIYNVSFLEELSRVIVHGVLHLIGYDDKSELDIQSMREKENYYLTLLKI